MRRRVRRVICRGRLRNGGKNATLYSMNREKIGTQPDKIIIGAGLYGLYAAKYCMEKGERVLVLEREPGPFHRATYVNQARVHMGYHYPRSLSTAMKSAGYFRRFCEDFDFCIEKAFDQIYATSRNFSWTNAEQFVAFCEAAGIPCEEMTAPAYFKKGMCDGAFLTQEYTYDAMILRDHFVDALRGRDNVQIEYDVRIERIVRGDQTFAVTLADGRTFEAPFLLNATYASTNQIISQIENLDPVLFEMKYELCEIILTRADERLKRIGITVMDGPFFSIMPFGKTGYHSLTAVSFTPHKTSMDRLPHFTCQRQEWNGEEPCTESALRDCNTCPHRPESAWPYMDHLARKYMKDDFTYEYVGSLYSMKPILKASEVDDSRPTAIRVGSDAPRLVSVLSGKINTVYDLDDYL